ncbi:hypothetical protein C1645_827924 [Glomus cerebriforme]|uniref:DUF8211 domain-containing protein n=1 Tax=Glomus cerebriforme TaxID=658196 RepID=A0A397SWS2_9GLOM|nr:hypothetical protein C1645_827924 [Glomus cerebriforme]
MPCNSHTTNLLHNINNVTSHRQGIFYTISIRTTRKARDPKKRNLSYTKFYADYCIFNNNNYTKRTQKRQQERRNQKLKQIASAAATTLDILSTRHQVIETAKIHHTLCSPVGCFNKVISHVNFNKHRDKSSLLFPTPRNQRNFNKYSNLLLPIRAPKTPAVTNTWTPIPPGITIDDELLPFVPMEPILTRKGNLRLIPGTEKWFNYIRCQKNKYFKQQVINRTYRYNELCKQEQLKMKDREETKTIERRPFKRTPIFTSSSLPKHIRIDSPTLKCSSQILDEPSSSKASQKIFFH